jgi:hypothetical protein
VVLGPVLLGGSFNVMCSKNGFITEHTTISEQVFRHIKSHQPP